MVEVNHANKSANAPRVPGRWKIANGPSVFRVYMHSCGQNEMAEERGFLGGKHNLIGFHS
jgi:hypothetical protein